MTHRFEVTEAAMRPASTERRCFDCHQQVGGVHAKGCVFVVKTAKVRVVVEYEVEVPADWDADMIEFHRNESSWCAGDTLAELAQINDGCLCGRARFKCIDAGGEPRLREKP